MTKIVITNQLQTMSSFAVRMDGVDGAVFIPARIAEEHGLSVGDSIEAMLVPNSTQADRTPWLAVRVDAAEPPIEETPGISVADKVRGTMRDGGVWTQASMFNHLFPNGERTEMQEEYNAVSAAFRAMFNKGECAKFQLWRTAKQSKPGREWFTCYPDSADVDEWTDEA